MRHVVETGEMRAILALVIVVCAFGLAFYGLVVNGEASIPEWAVGIVGAVIGYFFGARASQDVNGAVERMGVVIRDEVRELRRLPTDT